MLNVHRITFYYAAKYRDMHMKVQIYRDARKNGIISYIILYHQITEHGLLCRIFNHQANL